MIKTSYRCNPRHCYIVGLYLIGYMPGPALLLSFLNAKKS
jgi:hypothetical protein